MKRNILTVCDRQDASFIFSSGTAGEMACQNFIPKPSIAELSSPSL